MIRVSSYDPGYYGSTTDLGRHALSSVDHGELEVIVDLTEEGGEKYAPHEPGISLTMSPDDAFTLALSLLGADVVDRIEHALDVAAQDYGYRVDETLGHDDDDELEAWGTQRDTMNELAGKIIRLKGAAK